MEAVFIVVQDDSSDGPYAAFRDNTEAANLRQALCKMTHRDSLPGHTCEFKIETVEVWDFAREFLGV